MAYVLTVLTGLTLLLCVDSRNYNSLLTVTNGERFGQWTWPSMCPEKSFAVGFSIRVEPSQGRGDDTALNGIRLICATDEDTPTYTTVESHSGFFGDWSQPQYCPAGALNSFQLRVEPFGGGDVDDTSANNIRFRCSSNPTLDGTGMSWGDYGQWSQVCSQGGICGIQTKMEDRQGDGDDTTLNDVRFHCCGWNQQPQEKVFFQGTETASLSRSYNSLLTVTNGERFGQWTWPSMCPENSYAVGFSIRVESNQNDGDDTALNGIRLICATDDSRSLLYTVESHSGHWGDWTHTQYCPLSGVLTAFQLRVEPFGGGNVDDTSANNIRFRCSTGPTLEGGGMSWGDFGQWSQECSQGGICGIETKMEDIQGNGDDTALNDVRFHCCNRGKEVSRTPN